MLMLKAMSRLSHGARTRAIFSFSVRFLLSIGLMMGLQLSLWLGLGLVRVRVSVRFVVRAHYG